MVTQVREESPACSRSPSVRLEAETRTARSAIACSPRASACFSPATPSRLLSGRGEAFGEPVSSTPSAKRGTSATVPASQGVPLVKGPFSISSPKLSLSSSSKASSAKPSGTRRSASTTEAQDENLDPAGAHSSCDSYPSLRATAVSTGSPTSQSKLVNRDAAVRGETFNPHASVLVQGLSPSRRALEKALEAVATPRTPGAPLPLPLRSSNIHSRNLEISAALGSRDASSFYLPVAMTPDKVSAPVRGAQTAPQRSPLAASAVQNSARFECVTGRSKTPTKTPQSKLSASSAANPGASSVVRSSTAPVSDGAAQGCKAPQWVRVRGSLDRSNLPIVAVPCTPQQPSLESQHSADSPRRRLASRSPQPRAEADRLDDSVSRPKVGAASTARPQPSAQVHLSARRSVNTTPDHLQVPSGSERESKLSRETPVADLPSALRLSAVDRKSVV